MDKKRKDTVSEILINLYSIKEQLDNKLNSNKSCCLTCSKCPYCSKTCVEKCFKCKDLKNRESCIDCLNVISNCSLFNIKDHIINNESIFTNIDLMKNKKYKQTFDNLNNNTYVVTYCGILINKNFLIRKKISDSKISYEQLLEYLDVSQDVYIYIPKNIQYDNQNIFINMVSYDNKKDGSRYLLKDDKVNNLRYFLNYYYKLKNINDELLINTNNFFYFYSNHHNIIYGFNTVNANHIIYDYIKF